jgi:two-component system chemotaxis response regulator CheB
LTEKIRVLVADDSVVARRSIAKALEGEPDFEVTTTASGAQALVRLETHGADVVMLDIEMPEPDGLETLRRIRAKSTALPVIMCSTATHRGAAATVEALSAGATDYVTKPTTAANHAEAITEIRGELVRKIRAVVAASARSTRSGADRTTSMAPEAPQRTTNTRPGVRPDVLAIGCSTGGPNALIDVWRGLPRAFPTPILLVQHMPPVFTRMLAERLTALGGVPVSEATDGEALAPGHAQIAPGGLHMEVEKSGEQVCVRVHDGPPENSCRPAADVLFRSVARVYGGGVLGLVLTGMGQDALTGSRAIVEAGGAVIVQDEATSVVWGMPGFVARAGLARDVLPLSQIAPAVLRAFHLRPPHRTQAA